MTATVSVVTYFFPVDCDHSLANETLKLSLDKDVVAAGQGVSATYVTNPSPELLKHPAEFPKVRYWWSLLVGPGQPIVPDQGVTIIYGRLQDNPNMPVYTWRMRLPN